MIKKKTNFFVIPLAIGALIFLALYSNTKVDLTNYSTEGLEIDFTVSKDIALLAKDSKDAVSPISNDIQFPYLGKSYVGFKEALGFKESGSNYFRVNTLGYLGKYQFGAETLKLIGIYNPNQFLYNPELQEKAFLANAERNKWILRKDINRFVGKTIGGVNVTESGILAAAHLAGPGSVKKYLRSYGSNNFKDAYGTSIRHYLKKFSGYDTSHIVPNKKAKAVL
ncbi:peptidoglycan-binding protein LysM [Gaetbulibacter sp. PBL-D1]|uniref:peptidoglycan-binding protein LysM n=1 Tax=Gaetbulibacter sp. PBL-D1 TaxID=3422594 RepID=UPI003D2F47BF